MDLFPIGTISAATSNGTIEGITYSFFEPNGKVSSSIKYNIITSQFENQTIQTREKAKPYIMMNFEYDNIFDREFRQLEHFTDAVSDGLNSFKVPNLHKPLTPTSVVASLGDWIVSISNTRTYSTVENYKADSAFLWDGLNWKLGRINAITTNTSITVDVDTSNYGALTVTNAANALVYPLYTCYMTPDAIGSFKSTEYLPDHIVGVGQDGGWMQSGNLSFTGKFHV